MDHELSETHAPAVATPALVTPSFAPIANIERLWGAQADDATELRNNPRRVAADIMRLFIANKTPITLWGPVGSRKTRTIQSLSAERDENGTPYQVITIQPSTEDPTVIHGMMFTSLEAESGETVMKRSLPAVVAQIIDYWEKHNGLTILFMDEMTTCLPAQQHALLGLMTHGTYGDKNIQPYISIVMAANPEGTVSTVNDLGEQVINRGGHIAWFGDVSLFLEDWSSGFNNPSLAPSPTVQWYIKELLTKSSQDAFRNERWSPETLVPYDLMEHTERSVTELGRMIELIDKVFASSKPAIRKFYIIEVTRALLGNEWADKMSVLTEQESRRLSPQDIVERVRSLGITMNTTYDEGVALNAQEGIYGAAGAGRGVDMAQADDTMNSLIAMVTSNGFAIDAYIAAWAFAQFGGDEGFTMGLHRSLIKLVSEVAVAGVSSGALDRSTSVVPAFVSDDVKQRLRESLAAR